MHVTVCIHTWPIILWRGPPIDPAKWLDAQALLEWRVSLWTTFWFTTPLNHWQSLHSIMHLYVVATLPDYQQNRMRLCTTAIVLCTVKLRTFDPVGGGLISTKLWREPHHSKSSLALVRQLVHGYTESDLKSSLNFQHQLPLWLLPVDRKTEQRAGSYITCHWLQIHAERWLNIEVFPLMPTSQT